MIRAVSAILPVILLLLSVTLSTKSILEFPVQALQSTSTPTTPFKYVVTIVEENQPAVANIGIVGNPADAPYINNELIPKGALAANYHSSSHDGSLAQYIGMISGNSRCFDNSPDPKGGNPCLLTGDTIVDRLEASGRTWKAFMEDYPDCISNPISGCNASGCFMYLYWDGGGGQYLANHNPFVYFPQIYNSKDHCSNIVSANSVRIGYTKFGTDPDVFLKYLNSSSPANYIFMVPNHCDSFHGPFGPPTNNGAGWQCESYNSGPGFICPNMDTNSAECLHAQVKAGDTYLKQVVPRILSSKLFQTGDAALFITFDEPNSHPSRDPVCSNPDWSTPSFAEYCPILGLWVGGDKGPVKSNFKSSTLYTHYSYLKTIESAWQLAPLTTNDTKASAMGEFFTRPFPPPTSSFSFAPTHPVTGERVTFTADGVMGGAPPYQYYWKYGDGGSDIGQPVYHSYTTPSTFQIELNVTDSQGHSGISTRTVEVTTPLTSYFTYSPSGLSVGSMTSFTGQASGGKSPYSYLWDFGDHVKGNGPYTGHTYSAGGSYIVSLTVTDDLQHSSSSTKTLTISVISGSFTIDPAEANVGDKISFKASAEGGASPYTYNWSFGDTTKGTLQSITHSYSNDNTFTVTLNITDSANQFTTIRQQITINPTPISGSISISPETPTTVEKIRFEVRTTGGSAPYTFAWDFGDTSTSTGISAIHYYSTAGIFTVKVSVTDSSNHVQTKMIIRSVPVSSSLCAISSSCKITVSTSPPLTGKAATFSATGSGGIGPYTFSWDFGDGMRSTGSTVDHAYRTSGAFTIRLIVEDSAGHTYTLLSTINVKASPQQFSLPILAIVFASGAAIPAVAYTFRGRILRQFRD